MSGIDTGIIFFYLALMIAIGLYASRQQASVEDYFVASGKLGTVSIACLWMAGWVGGAAVVGSAAKAYDIGISASWYATAMAIGCLLFGLFFAKRVKQLGQQHNLVTYPELMETRYDSRTRIVATITTVGAFIAYAAGQLAAAAGILHTLMGWDFGTSLLIASAIIIVYTATGGFLAITYTDWVQVTLLFVGVVIVGIPVAISQGGTWSIFHDQLPEAFFDPGGWGWPTILALVVSISLSFFTAMDSYTRTFAARSPTIARRGVLLAIVFVLPLAVGATWLGMTSAILFPGLEDSSDILSTFVVQTFPVGLKGLVLVGILAALMSTADICILTASANLSKDVYQRYINPDVEPRNLFRISIGLSVIIGVVAALMAWRMQDVIDILLVGFTINSAALFLPSIAVVYFARANSRAAFWSIALSLATVIAWYVASQTSAGAPFGLDPLWPGLTVKPTFAY